MQKNFTFTFIFPIEERPSKTIQQSTEKNPDLEKNVLVEILWKVFGVIFGSPRAKGYCDS